MPAYKFMALSLLVFTLVCCGNEPDEQGSADGENSDAADVATVDAADTESGDTADADDSDTSEPDAMDAADSENGDTAEDVPTSTPDYAKLKPECFVPYSATPIIGRGNAFFTVDLDNDLRDATWSDPTVLKIDDEFIMYATSLPNDRPDDTIEHIAVYRFTSPDGADWSLNPTTPIFERTGLGTPWDADGVETPSVVHYEGEYHMFYTSYVSDFSNAFGYRIGHATSTDGIAWNRVTVDAPLISPSSMTPDPSMPAPPNLTFDQWVVAEPGAVVFDGKIHLYFAATGANTEANSTAEVIGLIIYDGATWSAQREVMRPDQTVYPRLTSPYYKGFSTPAATVINSQVHLFTTVVIQKSDLGIGYKHTKIHHAYSEDGETDWVQDPVSIVDHTELDWHANDIISPTALQDGNKVYLWYGGNNGTLESTAIGLMTCDL
jgi:predicted GH43/DUF377 family glycosyl hydrolase